LYGLHKTLPYIQESGLVYIAESEKAVMQGWSNGIKNVVSIGGHQLSRTQIKKLTHLGADICLCYDDKADYISQKINSELCLVRDDDFYYKERNKFLSSQKVYAVIDKNNKILNNKESPFDNIDKWEELIKLKQIL
jgi:DNA primase